MEKELTREEKIKLVKQDITKTHLMKLFEELVNSGGVSYFAGSGINIDDNNVISVVIRELIDNGDIVVNEDGKLSLSQSLKNKLDSIPTIKDGDTLLKASDIKENDDVKRAIKDIISEDTKEFNPWTEYKNE